jgi:dTDP-4-amino-4,6-dideoxygalactose transaminase
MNIDPAHIEKKISPRTKALLPVHFAGLPCAMTEINDIAARHGLRVIEDCAHAVEAIYRGRPTGTLGDFGCFSFYATKNVTTGEGGMVLARDPEHIGRIKTLALHGLTRDAWKRFSNDGYQHYQVVECGYKYNMMDLQAAIGLHQLKRVEAGWARRRAIWQRYQVAFAGLPLTRPSEPASHVRHAYHLYTVLIDEMQCATSRDVFMARMTAQGIGVGVHYLALPEHPYYQQSLGWRADETPHATSIGRQTVSLPLSPRLTDAEVERVINAVAISLLRSV